MSCRTIHASRFSPFGDNAVTDSDAHHSGDRPGIGLSRLAGLRPACDTDHRRFGGEYGDLATYRTGLGTGRPMAVVLVITRAVSARRTARPPADHCGTHSHRIADRHGSVFPDTSSDISARLIPRTGSSKNGAVECWNTGILDKCMKTLSRFSSFQHSIIPLFHHSNTPLQNRGCQRDNWRSATRGESL